MKPRLIQQQTLQWKMNQSLMQSINILQFSSLELKEYIDQLTKENPLIEEIDYDYDFEQYRSTASKQPEIGEINAAKNSMYDQLKSQLITLTITEDLKPVVAYGIDSLNSDGYLDVELSLWAEHCKTSIERVEEALTCIQSLEPAGIGARNLTECLILQLNNMGMYDFFLEELLEDHLEWIATEDYGNIAAFFDTTAEHAKKIVEKIRLCHPKPGQLLDTEEPEYIIPEASIYIENGSWKIKFFKWAAPTIKIDPVYANLKVEENEATTYLKEKYRQVEWLNQAISYRTNTLENIIRCIVEKQYNFFERGPSELKPFTLREISEELNIHLSTVSRAINQKYVQTAQGVLPIKFFLQSGIRKSNGESTSSIAVKQLILKLIQSESKAKPLSDEAIRKQLELKFGIKIARRTVMKYREQLNLPSSVKRRKKK
ncbi:RNA polymerase sigma-54 factor [Oceanobacillus piezotolerans]|uniref:RNA polymerase sigma-54 factor n=1 Tax=Oceanobacillus piezotolerans TaxID=2448030 RepID=A0A498DJH1_9BACI|nr:RNA polymerase factor sigma-54 [Oceanobacillus piezotolerans]RLL46612.1 RNA polymerase sigma-54 factor [Oceanobacillus piezotolerans]